MIKHPSPFFLYLPILFLLFQFVTITTHTMKLEQLSKSLQTASAALLQLSSGLSQTWQRPGHSLSTSHRKDINGGRDSFAQQKDYNSNANDQQQSTDDAAAIIIQVSLLYTDVHLFSLIFNRPLTVYCHT